jgi:F-type H+-transporting ATPase subunit b
MTMARSLRRFAAPAAMLAAWCVALPAVAAPEAHDAHDAGIQWISPVFGNSGKMGLLWILLNFAVLMWLLEKLLFSKLRAKTAAKSDGIKSELDRASAARKAAEGVMTDVRARLAKLDGEVASILDDAKARAEADRARIVAAAEAEAERIKATARASAEREAELRRRQLETEIVESAIARAEVILRGRINAADQSRMVDDFVGQVATAPMPGFTPNASGGPS